jgi:flagellar assembly factor FliW
MMRIDTAHFGCLAVDVRDVFQFPGGLAGLEQCRRWVLLSPPDDGTVNWLQAVDSPKAAFAVVDPCRFVPEYRLRTSQRELARLDLGSTSEAEVLVTVIRTERGLALDLKAPVVINRRRRLGRQVVSQDNVPLQYLVEGAGVRAMRKTA